MKIRQLFADIVPYPTAEELEKLGKVDTDMRHPDDRTPDLSQPKVGKGFKRRVLKLAKIISGRNT